MKCWEPPYCISIRLELGRRANHCRILQFQCLRDIGADLRLIEATVRTYTERIMLKLGINRQAEFFLLDHLTQSPFGAGGREMVVGPVSSDCRLNGDGEMDLDAAGKRPPN